MYSTYVQNVISRIVCIYTFFIDLEIMFKK